ncbi:chemotaxis protein CheB, partial [Rhizobiaceae sp. 2RAB30]
MNDKTPRKNRKPGRSKEPSGNVFTPLVGLGASAVSTDGVLRFFENAKTLASAAFVLVLQRSEALESKAFADALTAASGLAVETPQNGQAPQAGRIYLGTSNTKLTLADGSFRVAAAQELPG